MVTVIKEVIIMFNLIPPKKRSEFKDDLNQMFTLLELELGKNALDAFDHDEAYYLVYSHKKFGVIGGARLIPIDSPAMTSDLLKRLKFNTKQKIWELSRVFFHLPEDTAKDESEKMFELICRDFYQGMYDSLKTISIAQKIRSFITVLPFDDHQDVLHFGFWPFDKQASISSPYKDKEPYVVGFMPMNQDMYDVFIQRRMSYERIIRIS
jgi:hypothetical protein